MSEYLNCEITDNDPSEIIFGCIDPLANNYNPEATVDDGSCVYPSTNFSGCTDPYASNYSSSASIDDGSCVYLDCPTGTTVTGYYDSVTGEFINSPSGVYHIQLESGEVVSLPFRCCNEVVVGQPVYWNPETKSCINPVYVECPNPTILTPYSNGVDEPVYILTNNFGQPVTEECCSYLEDSYWDSEFIFNPGNSNPVQRGVCVSTQIVLECDLESSDLVFNADGTVNVANFNGEIIIPNIDTTQTNNICVNINSWTTFNPWSQGDGIIGYPEGLLLVLNINDPNAINLQVGQQIALSGMDIGGVGNTCKGDTDLTTLNLITKIVKILHVTGSNNYTIWTSVYFNTKRDEYLNFLCDNNISVVGSGKACVVYNQPLETITETDFCVAFEQQTTQNNYNPAPAFLPYNQFLGTHLGYETSLEYCVNLSYPPSNFDNLLRITTTDPNVEYLANCKSYEFNPAFYSQNQFPPTLFSYFDLYQSPSVPQEYFLLKKDLPGTQDPLDGPGQEYSNTTGNDSLYKLYFYLDEASSFGPSNIGGFGNFDNSAENTLRRTPIIICDKKTNYTPILNNLNNNNNILLNPIDFISKPVYTYSNLSEACCLLLGEGNWIFQDGKCYWTDTRDTNPPVVSFGVSETDILIEQSECTTLNVCMSILLEKPENPECLPEGDVIGTIGIYSGTNINDNILNVTQTTSYSLLEDGYCKWIQICADVSGFEGIPFKVRLDLAGLKNCCDYEVYIDDIVVNCIVEDSILVPTIVDCPGYTLRRVIDNKKSWVYNEGQTINRVFAPSIDADIPWRYTDYFNQSGVYEKHSKLVLNSKEMELTFNLCDGFNCNTGTTLTIYDLVEYKNNFQNFWVKFIEQFIPATTIFVAGEKWCTSNKNICPVVEVCDYDNSFDLSSLGIHSIENDSDKPPLNESFSDIPPIIIGGVDIPTTPTGGNGTNKTKPPLLLDGFVGAFIQKEPNILSNTKLTLPTGLLPLLQNGMDAFRSKMAPTTFIQT